MKKLNYVFWLCFLALITIIPMLWGGQGLLVIIFIGLMLLSFYFTIVYSYNMIVSFFGFKNIKRDYLIKQDRTKFLILVAAHNEESVIRETIRNLKQINYDKNLYNMIVSFFGFKNIKRDYLIKQDRTKFLILVAAHNEESVIRETIRNLKQINYDKNLYDICIVSDNSTDLTTQIALNENVLVVDTIKNEFEREGVGKPAGIQYALRKLGFENVKRQYDMIMVLDADNFVSKNILKEVNSQFITKGRPTAIQTYLDSKNYSKFMSLAYSVVFWTNNRFMQLAKYKLNLPNSIGGTGFFVKTDWLIDKGGFKFDSLTEDLEMEIEIINDGGRILWNDHASIYDEKAEETKVSMIQRHRWIKGHWYVAFKQILPLTKRFIMTLNIKYLDKIFFLMSMGKAFHIFLIFIVLIINIILLTHHHLLLSTLAALNIFGALHLLNDYMFYITGLNALLIIYSFVILPMYSVYAKLRNINPIKIVLSLQWFMITDFIVQLFGLFTWSNQQTWIRTPHSKVSIETSEEAYHTPGTYEHDNQPAIQVPEVGLNASNHIVEQHK